ncbi:MAG: hypothetical protein QM680_12875 [Luteolibacter sp.]
MMRILMVMGIMCSICIGRLQAGDADPLHFTNPEKPFTIQAGSVGDELSYNRIYPLNWVSKVFPEVKKQTIFRITRSGGWSKDSFLIIPLVDREAFQIDWHTSRWNSQKGKAGDGMAEIIITSGTFQKTENVVEIRSILENKLIKSPAAFSNLQIGEAGDDLPFLLVEQSGPKSDEGYLLPMMIYQFQVGKEGEALLERLEKLFLSPDANPDIH